MYFLKNASRIFWLVQTIFYIFFFQNPASESFFPSSENESFLKEYFIPAIEKAFLSSGNHLLYLRIFFLLAETVTYMSGNQLFKDRTYSCCIFFHCLRYFSRSSSYWLMEMHFSVQKWQPFSLIF